MTGVAKDTINDHVISRKLGMERFETGTRKAATTDEYEGSIPSLVTNDLWCNGNTTVFGTVVRGSNPCRSTNK